MQIIITGPRGCGKTTMAQYLYRHLTEELNQDVVVLASDTDEKRLVMTGATAEALWRRATITLSCFGEYEDEYAVKRSVDRAKGEASKDKE